MKEAAPLKSMCARYAVAIIARGSEESGVRRGIQNRLCGALQNVCHSGNQTATSDSRLSTKYSRGAFRLGEKWQISQSRSACIMGFRSMVATLYSKFGTWMIRKTQQEGRVAAGRADHAIEIQTAHVGGRPLFSLTLLGEHLGSASKWLLQTVGGVFRINTARQVDMYDQSGGSGRVIWR